MMRTLPPLNDSATPPSPPCRVVIVDDHRSISDVLAEVIQRQPEFEVAGIAHDFESACRTCAEAKPELLILDIGLPDKSDGLRTLDEVRKRFPEIKVLVFSAYASMHVVQESMRLGAHGFLEKTAPFSELLVALGRVRAGSTYLGEQASTVLRDVIKRGLSNPSVLATELATLRMLARGAVVKEIALQLDLSPSMVYKHLTCLREKFGAKTNEDLIVLAVSRGWLEADTPAAEPDA